MPQATSVPNLPHPVTVAARPRVPRTVRVSRTARAAIGRGLAALAAVGALVNAAIDAAAQGGPPAAKPPSAAAARPAKPRPRSGVDPGGVMVAFVGRGLDYTDNRIADRLARDGEGEIIGFDLIDRDRRPHCTKGCEAVTEAARTLTGAAPQSRIAVFRVDGVALAAPALQMAAQAKAAVVILDLPDDAQTAALLRAASDRFRDTLIVYAPRPGAQPAVAPPSTPPPAAEPPPPNPPAPQPGSRTDTVIVADTCPVGAAPEGAPGPPVTTGPRPPDSVIGCPAAEGTLQRAAVIAGMAARVVAATPSTRGATLRARLQNAP